MIRWDCPNTTYFSTARGFTPYARFTNVNKQVTDKNPMRCTKSRDLTRTRGKYPYKAMLRSLLPAHNGL